MLCQNCGKQQANVKYTQIINGVKKEMILCQSCAKKLEIDQELNFHIPMDLPSFLGEFLEGYSEPSLLSNYTNTHTLQCKVCGMTYDDFSNLGKVGCSHCYNVFSNRLDPILKNFHGSNHHVGRKGKLASKKASIKDKIEKAQIQEKGATKENTQQIKVLKLKEALKKAIKEERYEEAAKLRDEIKKWEKK